MNWTYKGRAPAPKGEEIDCWTTRTLVASKLVGDETGTVVLSRIDQTPPNKFDVKSAAKQFFGGMSNVSEVVNRSLPSPAPNSRIPAVRLVGKELRD
jgi:hypothetical protein